MPSPVVTCRGRWPEPQCKVGRPTLTELLAPNSARQRAWFWTFYIGSTVLVHATLYVFRTIFLLGCVEERTETPPPSKEHSLNIFEGDEFNEEHGLQDRMFLAITNDSDETNLRFRGFPSIHLALRRPQVLFSWTLRSVLYVLHRLVFYGPEERNLVTRNLSTSLWYLRYPSGAMPFRAVGAYVLWWVIVRRVATILVTAVLIIVWMLLVALPISFAGHKSSLFTCPFLRVGETLVAFVGSKFFTFHTLRVISASTGLTTNAVTSNVFSNALFRQPSLADIWLITPISSILYTIANLVANLVPYLIHRSLSLDFEYYSPGPAKRTSELILSQPEAPGKLIKAYVAWLALSMALTLPAAWNLFRRQAQHLALSEQSIVGYVRDEKKEARLQTGPSIRARVVANWLITELSALPKMLPIMLARTSWLRLVRLLLQMALVGAVLVVLLAAAAARLLGTLADPELLVDWFIREYLDFGVAVSLGGSARDLLFWWWPGKL